MRAWYGRKKRESQSPSAAPLLLNRRVKPILPYILSPVVMTNRTGLSPESF